MSETTINVNGGDGDDEGGDETAVPVVPVVPAKTRDDDTDDEDF